MHEFAITEVTFTLGALLRQNMTTMRLGALESARGRFTETLGGAPVGLHLRHLLYSYDAKPGSLINSETGVACAS